MATILFADVAVSTLAGAITSSDTSLALTSGTGALFPNPGANEYFTLTLRDAATGQLREITHCTARLGDVLTVVRGQQGTTALNWNAGDIAANMLTAGDMNAFVQSGQVQDEVGFYALDTGSVNSVVITPPLPTTMAGLIGAPIRVRKAATANTGAVVITVVGSGFANLVYPTGLNLNPSDLPGDGIFSMVFDGVEFQLQSVTSGNNVEAAISATPVGAFVNKFYNGSSKVFQRVAPVTVGPGSQIYTIDGALVGTSGASVSCFHGGAIGGISQSSLVVVGQAGVTDTWVIKPVESFDAGELAGKHILFQCFISNQTLTPITPSLTIRTPTAADNWAASTILFTGIALQTVAAAAGQVCSAIVTLGPSDGIHGLSFRVDVGAALGSAGVYVAFTDWDVREAATLTTPPPVPEVRAFSVEFLQCQRYLPGLAPGSAGNAGLGGVVVTNADAGVGIQFYTPARVPVTGLTLSSVADWEINVQGIPTALVTFTYNGSTSTAALLQVTGNNGAIGSGGFGSPGDACNLESANSSASLILTGAELDGVAI